MLNVDYNYLIGSSQPLPSDYNIDDRPDPDTDGCKKLYDDIIEAYFQNMRTHTVENVEQQFYARRKEDLEKKWIYYEKLNNTNPAPKSKYKEPPFYTIFIDKGSPDEILLSSDYFGPFVYWAIESGIDDDQIREFLQIGRTIGGHIVWPRGKNVVNKINESRAGNDGVYDRPDWTLILLKIYFENRDEKSFLNEANSCIPERFREKYNFNSKFKRLYKAFYDSNKWIDLIGSFESFCIQFKLKGSFVDDDFNVIHLTDLFPLFPKDYKEYIKNTCEAIRLRNQNLLYINYEKQET